MTHPLDQDAIVLCSGTVGPASLTEKATVAATAGFDGISFYVRELQAARSDGWHDGELRAHLAELGLSVAEADGMYAWTTGFDAAVPPVSELFAAAGAIGARSATLLLPPGDEWTGGLDGLARDLAAAADQAADHGLIVHLEPFAWSALRSLTVAQELCRRADRANVGIMLDAWHLAAGPHRGRLPDDFDATCVVGVQLGECADPDPPSLARAGMHDRLPPGDGPGTNATLVADLRAGGCTAPIGVEVYSDVLHAMTPGDAANLAITALRRALAS